MPAGLRVVGLIVAGGFTMALQERSPQWLRYRDKEHKLVIDLQNENNETAKESHCAELKSEDQRLMYVALTRPMFKLYLPLLKETGYSGWEGALSKVVAPAVTAANLEKMDYPHVGWAGPDPPVVEIRRPISPDTRNPPLLLPAELFPSADAAALRQRGIRVRSYSMLRKFHAPAAEALFTERPVHDDDDQPDPLEDPERLRGTVFGELVHETLEKIDFQLVKEAAGPEALISTGPTRRLLDEVFQNHAGALPPSLAADREPGLQQVAKVVWNALRTPLPALGCRLCDIAKEDRLHELEFHFPERLSGDRDRPSSTEGFFTGYMDLVFRQADRYYLLDWKTNDLRGDYSPEALKRCMDDSDYHRQYRLYLVALVRWLKKRVPRFEFERHLGGVFYLFVRGMNGRDQSGVWRWSG
jgi:ATP-dependent exoDNAse (exonuclease V) beta subunit